MQFYKRCVRLFLVTEHQILELLQNGFIMRCSVTTVRDFACLLPYIYMGTCHCQRFAVTSALTTKFHITNAEVFKCSAKQACKACGGAGAWLRLHH